MSVAVDPGQPVILNGSTISQTVAINLPAEVAVGKARVADDGTVVCHATDDGASAVVQVLGDGSTHIQTVTPDADGPHEFTYTFGNGIVPVMNANGTVDLIQQDDGIAVTVGTIDKSWAADAKGAPVRTSYQVKDGTLVQNITPTDRASHPGVADPSVSIGWRIYVKYDKSDVQRTATSSLSNKLKYQSLRLVVPSPIIAGACLLVSCDIVNSIISTVNSAYRDGKFMEVAYSFAGIPVTWKPVTC